MVFSQGRKETILKEKKKFGESLEEWLLSVWIAPKFAKCYEINREKS